MASIFVADVCTFYTTLFCVVPPVGPTLAISVLEGDVENGNANDTAVPVLVGSNVVIACDMIEAYTVNLVVTWSNIPPRNPRISTREVSISRELLMIDNIQRNDSDDYFCSAANNISIANKPITIKVGSLPDPYIILVESGNDDLSVSWELTSTTNNPEPVINLFVAYTQVNGSSPETKIQKIAPSVSRTVIRDLPTGVLYKVQVWSSNVFGNSTPSEEARIVITGTNFNTFKFHSLVMVNILTGEEAGAPITESDDDNSGAVIGAVVGVCIVVIILSTAVIIVVIFIFLHTKRTQAQQQWTKDPEFQVCTATSCNRAIV